VREAIAKIAGIAKKSKFEKKQLLAENRPLALGLCAFAAKKKPLAISS
jgi:hypothetical protein